MSTPSSAARSWLTPDIESAYAWIRLIISLLVVTIGNVGMYAASVVLPMVEADFGVGRADASLPYAATMVGFGLGGIVMGKLSDRSGIFMPVIVGAVALCLGFLAAGAATHITVFIIAHGVLIGLLGTSAMFAPMVADASHWFTRHRGIAVAICLSGNFLAGVVWPPIMQFFMQDHGWRATYAGIGLFCLATLVPLAFFLRRRSPEVEANRRLDLGQAPATPTPAAHQAARLQERPLGMSPRALLILLSIAGVACCVAMAMPQVQIVALCFDLGYGMTNGTNMLSLMLAMGIVSRLLFGMLSDRIGGLRVLLLGSILQTLALVMYLFSHGLMSLYITSAMFGLFQGGIVPAYAVIVRDYFSPRHAGTFIGTVLMATMVGMALGGWMSGAIRDLSSSYQAAFMNGIAWNVLNAAIVLFLLYRAGGLRRLRPQAA
ncbi:MFS transporter [Castellaniella sp.]|uniref:MFS transporter n=1 Tax=Castellaniella sp. TaxID=1955812 RepID=UPI003563B016